MMIIITILAKGVYTISFYKKQLLRILVREGLIFSKLKYTSWRDK